jgi:LPS export ABC transporter protein LptC
MRQLSQRILIVVALFVLVVGGMVVARSRAIREAPLEPLPSRADLSIKDVELEEQSGAVRWQLRADQALVYDDEGRTSLENVAVRVDQGQRVWTIVAREGDLYKADRRIEVRGNVVVTADDGLRLETSVLRWDEENQRMWTDAPVRLTRSGAVVEGQAIDVRMADAVTSIGGRVHATFQEGGTR